MNDKLFAKWFVANSKRMVQSERALLALFFNDKAVPVENL